jgi:hypothetical protein
MRSTKSSTIASATVCTVAALVLMDGNALADGHAPASPASCAAAITVAETRIAPGNVGDELRRITALGPSALPGLVRLLATNHLGTPEACAALIGE